MFWAGVLAMPLLLIEPLVSNDFFNVARQNGGVFMFIFARTIISFSFGALASAIYEIFFHKKITPKKHPHRKKLIWLFLGIILFFVLKFIFHQNFILSLIVALFCDVVAIIFIRKDLIWDLIFSGFFMGVLYFSIFLIIYRGLPGGISNLWFGNSSIDLTLFAAPIEELFAAMLWGALWGPIYVVAKDLKEK